MKIVEKVLVENIKTPTAPTSLGMKIATALTADGIYAVTRERFTPATFDEVRKDRISGLVIDCTAGAMDEEFETQLALRQTAMRVFVITPENAPPILEKSGVLFISESLGTQPVIDLLRYSITSTGQKLDNAIARTLMMLGILPHLNGYKYLCMSIEKIVRNHDLISDIVNSVYQIVADTYDTTVTGVEKSIRHSITIAYERFGEKPFNDFFGYRIVKPGNTEFISVVSERIRLAVFC